MSDGNGNTVNALARTAVRALIGLLTTLLIAWASWLTHTVLDGMDRLGRISERVENTNRRIDGVATVLQGFCKPDNQHMDERP